MELYKVKNRAELREIITCGEIPLETLDVSAITDMNSMFQNCYEIHGDISNWNMSQVTNMERMFYNSHFNGDISKWDTSSVKNMNFMFYYSKFDSDISKWNVSNVTSMRSMFENSKFNQDISSWNVFNVVTMKSMFEGAVFYRNIGSWDLSNKNISQMFQYSERSYEDYVLDRSNYLLQKEKEDNEKYIFNTKQSINESLNQDILLSTIEMEF